MTRVYFESPTIIDPTDESAGPPRHSGSLWKILGLAALALGFTFGGVHLQREVSARMSHLSLAEIQHQAYLSDRLILLYLTSPDCLTCVQMDRQGWTDERVTRVLTRRYEVLRLSPDSAEYADVREQYDLHTPPTLLITSAQGEVVKRTSGEEVRHVGYLSPTHLYDFVNNPTRWEPNGRKRGEIPSRARDRMNSTEPRPPETQAGF